MQTSNLNDSTLDQLHDLDTQFNHLFQSKGNHPGKVGLDDDAENVGAVARGKISLNGLKNVKS